MRRQLAVSGNACEVPTEVKSSKPLPPLRTSVPPSCCMEDRKWTASTWPLSTGVGLGGCGNSSPRSVSTGGRERMDPALVPTRRELEEVRGRREVILRPELLC